MESPRGVGQDDRRPLRLMASQESTDVIGKRGMVTG